MTERLMTGHEVAALLSVDPKTVSRWGAQKRLTQVKTPGNHSRYLESEIRAMLERSGVSPDGIEQLLSQP